jgi:hypothetical protein
MSLNLDGCEKDKLLTKGANRETSGWHSKTTVLLQVKYISGSRTPFQFPSKRLPPEKVYRRMSDQDDSVLERIACKFRSVLKSLKEKV